MKFKFIHKISEIQSFFVIFKMLRGPDITPLGAGSGLRVVHLWSKRVMMNEWQMVTAASE